jgi:hypothetical protein
MKEEDTPRMFVGGYNKYENKFMVGSQKSLESIPPFYIQFYSGRWWNGLLFVLDSLICMIMGIHT